MASAAHAAGRGASTATAPGGSGRARARQRARSRAGAPPIHQRADGDPVLQELLPSVFEVDRIWKLAQYIVDLLPGIPGPPEHARELRVRHQTRLVHRFDATPRAEPRETRSGVARVVAARSIDFAKDGPSGSETDRAKEDLICSSYARASRWSVITSPGCDR
jgi:hypothetical protein